MARVNEARGLVRARGARKGTNRGTLQKERPLQKNGGLSIGGGREGSSAGFTLFDRQAHRPDAIALVEKG